LIDKYSLAAGESDAEIPVINPIKAMTSNLLSFEDILHFLWDKQRPPSRHEINFLGKRSFFGYF